MMCHMKIFNIIVTSIRWWMSLPSPKQIGCNDSWLVALVFFQDLDSRVKSILLIKCSNPNTNLAKSSIHLPKIIAIFFYFSLLFFGSLRPVRSLSLLTDMYVVNKLKEKKSN